MTEIRLIQRLFSYDTLISLSNHQFSLIDDAVLIEPQHGDVFWEPCIPERCPWTNCEGRHLRCFIDEGHGAHGSWDIDSRASNCTMKEDCTHRCWVRHGEPSATLHVDKNGETCKAGTGSIVFGKYHGFIDYGELVTQRKRVANPVKPLVLGEAIRRKHPIRRRRTE
jgi:hypothetical protein